MFGVGYVDDDRAMSVFAAAFDAGINFIDTANMYHAGLSKQVVGRTVSGRRHDVVVATKGGMAVGTGVVDSGASKKHLVQALEDSLRRLDTDYIDLYQIHQWDHHTPLEETLRTLDDMVRQGKVRYIGCSNYAAWQLGRALWVSDKLGLERFESVQPAYNFTARDPERELFPLCEDQGVGVVPYQVLMGGVLAGGYESATEPPPDRHMSAAHSNSARQRYWNQAHLDMAGHVKEIAADAGHEPTAVVLAWALSKPAATSVIVGSSGSEQVTANAPAADLKLPRDVLVRLGEL